MSNISEFWYFNNSFNVKDLVKDMNLLESELEKYHVLKALLTIIFFLISWYLVLMIVLYERYGMDPMKRGLSNRLVSSFFSFGIISFPIFIIEEINFLVIDRNPDSKKFYGFNFIFFVIGSMIVMFQIIFWKYLTKKVLKRIPAYNHDLIGVWLELSNLVLAFGLAGVEAFGKRFAGEFNTPNIVIIWPFYPNIAVPPIFAAMIYLQTLVATVQSIVDYMKNKNSNRVWSISLPNTTNQLQINNSPYNAEIGDTKACIIALCIGTVPIVVKEFSLIQTSISTLTDLSPDEVYILFRYFEKLAISILLFIPPALYFVKERKIRQFTSKFSTCKCSEI